MKIHAHTKVSEVLKASSQAIDALISISAKFSKLKNPLLRKMMAPRVTLKQAAKIGGVRIDDIFIVLKPLGFDIDSNTDIQKEETVEEKVPDFAANINQSEVLQIDVRDIIAAGDDPLNLILSNVKKVKEGQIFAILNSFEPIPIIHLLEKKGYESYVQYIDTEEVLTYFHKKTSLEAPVKDTPVEKTEKENFSDMLKNYQGNTIETDVRHLEMPMPMLTILELVESLPSNHILYVHHKKIPVYLLPELEDKGFEYFIHEVEEGEVKLIIRRKL